MLYTDNSDWMIYQKVNLDAWTTIVAHTVDYWIIIHLIATWENGSGIFFKYLKNHIIHQMSSLLILFGCFC